MEKKTYIDANTFLRDSWRLAADVMRSGWRPGLVLALWRGGAFAGVAVHEFFKACGLDVDHLPLKCGSYSAIGVSSGTVSFTLGDETFGMVGRGERVLVVDDIFDTGNTAVAVKARLDAAGAETRFACIYWKRSKNTTDIEPDYYVRDIGSDWVVFPHEIEGLGMEDLREKDPFLVDLAGDLLSPRHESPDLAVQNV